MMHTIEAEFKEVMSRHVQFDAVDVAGELERLSLISDNDFPGIGMKEKREARIEVANAIVNRYIANCISKTFPMLDPEIFELRRYIVVEVNPSLDEDAIRVVGEGRGSPPAVKATPTNGVYTRYIAMPLLVKADFDDARRVHLGRVSYPGQARRSISATCTFPGGVTPSVVRATDTARAIVFEAFATLLRNRISADVVRTWHSGQFQPSIEAYWIPTLESMTVNASPSRTGADPAVVIEIMDQRFLVGMWDSDEELPLDSLMREFSVGRFRNR